MRFHDCFFSVPLAAWLLAASASAATPLQSPQAVDDSGVKVPTGELALNRLNRVHREQQTAALAGAWQLHSFLNQGTPVSSDEITGEAVFGDGFMSLVIHAVGYNDATGRESEMAQAGIFRWSVDDFGSIQTLTVIGHSSPGGQVNYEPIGSLREYRLDVDAHQVVLRHHSGRELSFIRVQSSGLSGLEIARLSRELLVADDSFESGVAGEVPLDGDPIEGEEGDDPSSEQELVGYPDRDKRAERAQLELSIQGAWYLDGYIEQGVPVFDDDMRGAALICNGQLSLVIHALAYGEFDGEEVHYAQAGIYEYRLTGTKLFQTSTILGHSNPLDALNYEPAGSLRQYEVSIDDDVLILRNIDGTALRFVRLNRRRFTNYELDFFNRYGEGADATEDSTEEE